MGLICPIRFRGTKKLFGFQSAERTSDNSPALLVLGSAEPTIYSP